MRKVFLLAMLFFPSMAFAAGGTCPASSNYMEPVYGNTTGTLSSFGVTSCYFIDFVGGADTNAGTTEGAAWQHAPGMVGCANNCSSATISAGTGFILKGGVTWTSATQQWVFAKAGSSGSPNYIGYDPAWFSAVTGTVNTSGTTVTWVSGLHSGNVCTGATNVTCSGSPVQVGDFITALVGVSNGLTINGTAYTVDSCASSTVCTLHTSAGTQSGVSFSFNLWTRPIISGSNTSSSQLRVSVTFVDVDNLEFTDMANSTACCAQAVNGFSITSSGNRDVHLYNNYFHGANVAHDGTHASTYVSWPTTGNDNTSTVHDNVFDNSDFCVPGSNGHGPCTMTAMYDGPRQVFRNYVGYMGGSSFVLDNPIDIHNNTIEYQSLSVDAGTDHENMIESNGETGSGMVMYNNVVQHGYNCGVVDFQSGPNTGITSYMFNNILPDMDGCNMEQTYEGGSSLGTADWFNNTAESGLDSGNPGGDCGRSTSANNHSNVTNQHCITTVTGTSWWSGAANATFTTNLPQSKATASGQGYTLGSTYSFQPTSGGGSTVGAGTNKTAYCSTITSGATTITAVNTAAGTACGQDTSYGVNYDNISHAITGVGRVSTNARPSSGAWDIGAYEFAAVTQANPPSCSPGSGTYTANQTVTCTNPNSGTTVMCYSTSTTPATNGSGTGCTTGTQYTTALTVSANETLNVIAGTSTLTDSAVVTYSYVLQGGAPVCSPVGGTYIGTQSVALSQPQSLAIGYTTNGTSPVSNGSGGCSGSCTLYSGAISVASSETIKSIGMASGWTDSSIASCAYVINAPAATDMTMKGVTSSQGVTIVQ